jgi:hypothetical protein
MGSAKGQIRRHRDCAEIMVGKFWLVSSVGRAADCLSACQEFESPTGRQNRPGERWKWREADIRRFAFCAPDTGTSRAPGAEIPVQTHS